MRLKEALKKFLKSIGADTRSALVGYIVAVLIVAGGGLSALYTTSREWVLQILTTPTPLWTTILLILSGYLYNRIIVRKKYSSEISLSTPVQPVILLDAPKIDILKLLYTQDNLTTEQIASSLQLQRQTATFHLEELKLFKMINTRLLSQQTTHNGIYWPVRGLKRYYAWSIIQNGRKYLLDNKCVS